MLGWRLLRHTVLALSCGWGSFEGSAMGRAGWVGLAARLMFAGQGRSRALRSKLPQTRRGGAVRGHSRCGDRCCSGGCPAHGQGVLACSQPGRGDEMDVVHRWSVVGGDCFSPEEPSELAGDGGDDHFAVVLAGIEAMELAA